MLSPPLCWVGSGEGQRIVLQLSQAIKICGTVLQSFGSVLDP